MMKNVTEMLKYLSISLIYFGLAFYCENVASLVCGNIDCSAYRTVSEPVCCNMSDAGSAVKGCCCSSLEDVLEVRCGPSAPSKENPRSNAGHKRRHSDELFIYTVIVMVIVPSWTR